MGRRRSPAPPTGAGRTPSRPSSRAAPTTPRTRRWRNSTSPGRLPRSTVSRRRRSFDWLDLPGHAIGPGVVPGSTARRPPASRASAPSLTYYSGTYAIASQLYGPDAATDVRRSGPAPYTVLASFPGSTDYASGAALADFSIAPATPTRERRRRRRHLHAARPSRATATVAGVNGTPGPTLESIAPVAHLLQRDVHQHARSSTATCRCPAPRPTPARTRSWPASPALPITPRPPPLANFSIAPATPTDHLEPAGLDRLRHAALGHPARRPPRSRGPSRTPRPPGTILDAGTGQTLSVTFTPRTRPTTPRPRHDHDHRHPGDADPHVSAPGGGFDGSPFAGLGHDRRLAGPPGRQPGGRDPDPDLLRRGSGTGLGPRRPRRPGPTPSWPASRATPITPRPGRRR